MLDKDRIQEAHVHSDNSMCTVTTVSTAQRIEAAFKWQQKFPDSQSHGYLLLVRSSMRRALRRSTKWGTCCSSQRAMLSHCRRERPAMPAGKAPSGCWAAPNKLSSKSRVSSVLKVLNTYRISNSVAQHLWMKTAGLAILSQSITDYT